MVNLTSFVKDMGQITQALGAIQETSRSFANTVSSINETYQDVKNVFGSDEYSAEYTTTDSDFAAETTPVETESAPIPEASASRMSTLSVTSSSNSMMAPATSMTNNTYNYPSEGYTARSDWRISLDEMSFSKVGSLLSHAAGGASAAYHFSAPVANHVRDILNASAPQSQTSFGQGLKGLGIEVAKGIGVSALVSMGVSAIVNGASVASGKQTGQQALQNLTKDTIGGAIGGLGAVAAGGLGQLLLGKTGTFGLIASVAMGAIGGVIGGRVAAQLTSNDSNAV